MKKTRYVIVRDDDTNAFTPVECLERLYRPFLDRGLPVNLAVIPDARTDTVRADGLPEEFLFAKNEGPAQTKPIGVNRELVGYLQGNSGFHVVQHGYDHSFLEFDSVSLTDVRQRLAQGTRLLMDAGFARPQTFVAPYDRFSSLSLRAATEQFRVISTGWFELERLPVAWWPKYALRKLTRRPHWRVGRTLLLSHPGCILSRERPRLGMLEKVQASVFSRQLTVLVTHWWEYFDGDKPCEPFVQILHETAAWLAKQPDLKVVTFADVAAGCVPLG